MGMNDKIEHTHVRNIQATAIHKKQGEKNWTKLTQKINKIS